MYVKTRKTVINVLFAVILLCTVVAMIILMIDWSKPPENTDDKISVALAGMGGFVCLMVFVPIILVEFDVFFIFRYIFLKKEKTVFKTRINIICGCMDILIFMFYLAYVFVYLVKTVPSIIALLVPVFFPLIVIWILVYIPVRAVYFKSVYLDMHFG